MCMLFSLFALNAHAKVYATVNGETITEMDLAFLRQIAPNIDLDNLPAETLEKAINQAIDQKLLLKEAKRSKIESTPEFKEALLLAKDALALDVYLKRMLDDIKISDKDLKDYYDTHKGEFQAPESARARHILVDKESDAKAIIEKLKKTPKDKLEEVFISLAKEKSKDSGASEGGDLGEFTRDQMVPEFSNAIFALSDNTISLNPIKTQFGYHVAYLKYRNPARELKFEEVRGSIEQNVKLNKFRAEVDTKAKSLRSGANITINKIN